MRHIYGKKRYFVLALIIQIVFLTISGLLFQADLSVIFYRNMLIVLYFECVAISLLGEIFNVLQLFLVSSFFFIVNRAFMECFFGFQANFFSYASITVTIPDLYMIIAYKVYCVSLLCTSIGWLLGLLIFQKRKLVYTKENIVGKGVDIVFGIAAVLYAYKLLLTFKYYLEIGYKWRITRNLTYPWFLTGMGFLFTIFSIYTLFFLHSKHEYLKKSFIIVFTYFLLFITGVRSEPIYVLMTILFIWTYFHQKMRVITVAFMGVLSLLGIYIVGIMRTTSNTLQFGRFLWQQSISFCVLPLFVMYKDKMARKVPYAFGYILDLFSASNVPGPIEHEHRLTQLLIYQLDFGAYQRGENIGTSQSAEFYDLVGGNLIMIGILYIVVIFLLMYILTRLYDNLLFFYFGYIFMGLFIYSPRYSVFYIMRNIYVYGFFVTILLYALCKMFRNIYIKSIKLKIRRMNYKI